MRKILFLLIVLACTLPPPPADADSFVVISRPCPGGVAAATPHCDDATHDGAGNSITMCEDFDGSTSCATSHPETCRNTFTVVGTIDFDDSTNKIEGTYSLNGATASYIYKALTEANDYYAFFMVRFEDLPGSTKTFFTLQNGGTVKFSLKIGATGAVSVANGTKSASTVGTYSADTTYYVWCGYTKGSGADGTAYVAVSTDITSKPTTGNNYASIADGDANSTITRVGIGPRDTSSFTAYYDHVRINTSDIAANPQ